VRRLLAEKKAEENRLLGASIGTEAVHKVALEISDLHDRAVEIESQLQGNNPEYFQMQIEPLAVDKVQSLIGDEDIVLEYSLGSSHSYLWAISRTGFSSYALPPEGEIEAVVRRFRRAVVSPGLQPGKKRALQRETKKTKRVLPWNSDACCLRRFRIWIDSSALSWWRMVLCSTCHSGS